MKEWISPDVKAPTIGVHHLGIENVSDEYEIQKRTARMLSRALNIRRVVGFVGSGLSMPFGYRSWDEFAKSIAQHTLKEATLGEGEARLLQSFLKDSDSQEATLPVILDRCEAAMEREGKREELREYAATLFDRPEDAPQPVPDPYELIISGLGIHRFLTTNYDDVIENAFVRVLGSPRKPLGLRTTSASDPDAVHVGPSAVSLAYDLDRPEALVQFAVGAPGYERGVFHLHGRPKRKGGPKSKRAASMVITERDYQRAYLRDDATHRTYREALDVALSANAVLFLGVGMKEPDLLRPLRQFVGQAHPQARNRPLFALLPKDHKDDTRWIGLRVDLYVRYGIKALFFPTDFKDVSTDFCLALQRLAQGWQAWWTEWEKKPGFRRAYFATEGGLPETMIRHQKKGQSLFDIAAAKTAIEQAVERSPLTVIVGPRGSGKGTLALQLVRTAKAFYGKCFFATLHFSNEFLSLIDAATAFLGTGPLDDRPGKLPDDPLSRFKRALRVGSPLVVIGGLERLLIPAPLAEDTSHMPPGAFVPLAPLGIPQSREVEQFLEILSELKDLAGARVVVTTTMWPAFPDGLDRCVVPLNEIPYEAVNASDRNWRLRPAKDIHRVLRGHAYALSLVHHVIGLMKPKDATAWMKSLLLRLSAAETSRRPGLTVEACLTTFLASKDDEQERRRLLGLLQRVALFTTPVGAAAMKIASLRDSDVSDDLATLANANLLLDVEGSKFKRYTAHTEVRRFVLRRLGRIPGSPGQPQRLELTGFVTEGPPAQRGTLHGHRLTTTSVDALLKKVEEDPAGADRDHVRGAFGLIRSRWTATSIGRQAHLGHEVFGDRVISHYGAYMIRLVRLANVLREQREPKGRRGAFLWNRVEQPREEMESDNGLLYVDELAWLYNEMALTAHLRGDLHDAYALYTVGESINDAAERGSRHYRWCHSQVCLGEVHVERARFDLARRHLELALRRGEQLGDKDIEARARGYLGLLHHLTGDYGQADLLYRRSIDMFAARGNRRGISVFCRHRADLSRVRNRLDDAYDDIRRSVSAAAAGSHPDLIHYARIAQANIELQTGAESSRPTMARVDAAIEFARIVGIPRLEADACKVKGHIALRTGDVESSVQLALRCLSLTSARGMRLRSTAALVFLGQVSQRLGRKRHAKRLLQSALELAERQGYQIQMSIAARELFNMEA